MTDRQKLAAAGFTRRKTGKTVGGLMREEPSKEPDMSEQAIELPELPGPAATLHSPDDENMPMFVPTQMQAYARQAVLAERAKRSRVLDHADPFCPKCGHNRDKSSVSSIDHGDGRRSCQMCGADWLEIAAAIRATAGKE
jgi:hypothetical protein